MGYATVKALHIIFVTSWFAGLFYLPRIYVNLAMVPPGSEAERWRLILMSRKLLRFMHILVVPALGFGLWLWLGYGIGLGSDFFWMHAKLAAVAVAVVFHILCIGVLRSFEAGTNHRSHVWFRWFNEVPTLVMFAAVLLVVLKPF